MSSSSTCFYINFQDSQATWIDPVSKQNENQFCLICKSKLSDLYNVSVNVLDLQVTWSLLQDLPLLLRHRAAMNNNQ